MATSPKKKPVPKKPQPKGRKQRKTTGRRGKKAAQEPGFFSLSGKGFYVVAACLAVLLSTGFYFFFIRPYAYRWKPCYGAKMYGVCLPLGYEIHGIDLSHHQGDIDWEVLQTMQSNGFPLRFAFIKATEGGDLADPRFSYNFAQARSHGYIRGAYHFFNPSTPASRQADFFIRTVQLEHGDLPPVLDVERRGKLDRAELQEAVKCWLDKVERHYGVKPILYTSYKFKMRYLSDPMFDAYPYWIAHYYVDSVRYEGAWRFWQHTDRGIVPGIPQNVDLNIFKGSMDELQALTLP